MSSSLLSLFASAAVSAPLLAIVLILAYYYLLRLVVMRLSPQRRRRVFCPSAFALGMAFQFMQVYHRPSMVYVLEAKKEQQAEEEESGDPDTPLRHFHRQLRRIRQGELPELLVLRL
jgi:hypothetical protein